MVDSGWIIVLLLWSIATFMFGKSRMHGSAMREWTKISEEWGKLSEGWNDLAKAKERDEEIVHLQGATIC